MSSRATAAADRIRFWRRLASAPPPSTASMPKATLAASVSEKRNGSCGTNPIAPLNTANGHSRTSTPSTNTVPGGRIVQAGQQADERRTFRSRSDRRARRSARTRSWQRHAASTFVPPYSNVRSRNSISPRISRPVASGFSRIVGVRDGRHRVEHLEHPLPRRHAALDHVGDPAERDHRPAEQRQIPEERDELAERQASADDFAAPVPDDHQGAEPEKERHAREKEPLHRDQPAVPADELFIRPARTARSDRSPAGTRGRRGHPRRPPAPRRSDRTAAPESPRSACESPCRST